MKFNKIRFYKQKAQARSSGGERYLDTVEVGGSKPPGPTMTYLRKVIHLSVIYYE